MKLSHRLTAFFLALLMLLSSLPLTALANESDLNAISEIDYSHSNPNAKNVSLSPSRLLAAIAGEHILTEAEAAYADLYFDRALWYYDQVPAGNVTLIRNGTTVTVTAEPFAYKAANGQTVTWTPEKVMYNLCPVDLDEHYTCAIENVPQEDNQSLQVIYSCSLSVPKAIAQELLYFAYNDASAAEDLPTADEYARALDAYRAYLAAIDEYREACEAFDNLWAEYTAAKADYDQKKPEYDAYLVRLSEYERAKSAHDAYLTAKEDYRQKKAEYERLYQESVKAEAAYAQYLDDINRIRTSLYAMESLFVTPTSKKTGTLFNALQNAELITMFESNRDTLVAAGVSDATLTQLRADSDTLNNLLIEYANARVISERDAFAFYAAHYDEICALFNLLYDGMCDVMTGSIFKYICTYIELTYQSDPEFAAYRKWRVKNVLCHIYLICLALDDGRTADGQWVFYADGGKPHTYSFSQLLDQNLILTDVNSASPKGLTYPEEVERIVLPEIPKEPAFVAEPIAPAPVSEPREPQKPTVAEPEEPAFVAEPDEQSAQSLAFAERAQGVVAELKNGSLLAQSISRVEQDIEIAITKEIHCPISPTSTPLVRFYNADGSLVFSKQILAGGSIEAPDAPSLKADAAYSYEFLGWATVPDIDPENEDDKNKLLAPDQLPAMPTNGLVLYAIYQKTLQEYTVTFEPDNGQEAIAAVYPYGHMPTCPDAPQKEASASTVYTFVGWSPAVSAVTADATYTAIYLETPRAYAISFATPAGRVERTVTYGNTPTPPAVPKTYYENCVRYDFIGWDSDITPVTNDAVYTAKYKKTVLAETEDTAPTLVQAAGEYRLEMPENLVKIDKLLSSAQKEDRRVVFAFAGLTVTLNASVIPALQRERVMYASLLTDTAGGVGVGLYDESGASLCISGLYLTIPREEEIGRNTLCYTDASGYTRLVPFSAQNGAITTLGASGQCYRTVPQYTLAIECEGGSILADAARYLADEKISLVSFPNEHHVLSSALLVRNDTGEEIPIESLTSLTMPAYDATLRVVFVPKTYTIAFVSRGETVFSGEFRLGETVVEPQIVTDFEENGYRYTFIGWSSPIGAATKDTVYTAKFYAVNLSDVVHEGDGTEWATGAVIRDVGIPAILVLALLIFAIVLLILQIRKTSKKKKKKKKKSSVPAMPEANKQDTPSSDAAGTDEGEGKEQPHE